MKQTRRTWKTALAGITLAAMVASPVVGGMVFLKAGAVTVEDAGFLQKVAPNTLEKINTVRLHAGQSNPNFADGTAKARNEYGGPWSFTHCDEFGGPDNIPNYSSFKVVDVNDAVEGMGMLAGTGDLIETALEITINQDNQNTLYDSLTYSSFDDLMWGTHATEPMYFSAWIKAEQDMWFDIGISYGAAENHAQVYFDLGRRFFVKAGEWTQIGMDEEDNFLPFRSKVISTGFLRGTGPEPTAENSNCASESTYAKEDMGDTNINPWYREGFGNVWACCRIYAYSGTTYGTTGIGNPAATHGMNKGDKYLVTGVNFFGPSDQVPETTKAVASVTLDKTTASVEEGKTLQLTATAAPEDATDKTIYWTTSDSTVADVDQTGKVTAKKAGTLTITAEANDGNGASATCEITVTAAETPNTSSGGNTSTGNTSTDEKSVGCCGSVAGIGAAVAVIAAGGAILSKKKRG